MFLSMTCITHGQDVKPIASPFAVVELFTSEGCSSCPPAEKLLNEIHAQAKASKQRIFVLAFHVDYWDRLGWKDRFGDAKWTQRQYRYGQALRARNVYTPQMIVNGQAAFVGSKKTTANKAIRQALKQQPIIGIQLKVARFEQSENVISIRWKLDDLPKNCELVMVLVEDGLSTDVRKGENAGKKLQHNGIVRTLKKVAINTKQDKIQFPISHEVNRKNAHLIAFVQQIANMKIIGAHRQSIAGYSTTGF